MMYTTAQFSQGLIEAVKNFMVENSTKVLPLDFLANRSDYPSCKVAKVFYEHGFRYFFVEDGKLKVHKHYTGYGMDSHSEYIVDDHHHPYPDDEHICIQTADLVALVGIAYDTLGSIHFKGRGSKSWTD